MFHTGYLNFKGRLFAVYEPRGFGYGMRKLFCTNLACLYSVECSHSAVLAQTLRRQFAEIDKIQSKMHDRATLDCIIWRRY